MTDIVAIVNENPVMIFADEKNFSEFYNRVEEEVSKHVPDVSTEKGRKEIASLAYKVTRSKTAIDAAGKKLNEDAREKINIVDAARRKIREELDALAEKVREPLTNWENAEKRRIERASDEVARINELALLPYGISSDEIQDRINALNGIHIFSDVHKDRTETVERNRVDVIARLESAYQDTKRAEEERAEFEKLKAESEERERLRIEAEQKAEADRIEKERAEKAEADRVAREKKIAEDAQNAERERIQREADEKIRAAENEARRVKEEAERAENARLEAERIAREQEDARQKDRAHRGEVMKSAKDAIMTHGVDETVAKQIVLAIVAGEIPNVVMRF